MKNLKAQVAALFILLFSGLANAADTHQLFKNQNEALSWAATNAQWLRAAVAPQSQRFQVLPADPRYAKLQGYVHQLWEANKALFPKETSGLNEPPVVLIDCEVSNAFFTANATRDKIVHAVIVLTGFLDAVGGVDKETPILGTLAHELAHSVFRHQLSQFQGPINRFYYDAPNVIPYSVKPDPSLEQQMEPWLENTQVAGELTYDEQMDLPPGQSLSPFPLSMLLLSQIYHDFASEDPACLSAKSISIERASLFHRSNLSDTFSVGDLNRLKSVSLDLINAMKTCLKDQRKPFLTLTSEALGVPESILGSVPSAKLEAVEFDQSADLMTGLTNLVHKARQTVKDVGQRIDIKRLGRYTYEEHADEVSAIVNAYLGKDASSQAEFFKLTLGQLSKDDLATCESMIAQNTIPPIGSLAEPHHALCYRIFNLKRMKEYIPKKKENIGTFATDFIKQTNAY